MERNSNGLRVTDMAEQLGANARAVYRDLEVLENLHVPPYPDKNGRESFWKVDPDYRNRSIPFSLSELLSLYLAQDSIRPASYPLPVLLLVGSRQFSLAMIPLRFSKEQQLPPGVVSSIARS